jgi:integrase/recombinase XerD
MFFLNKKMSEMKSTNTFGVHFIIRPLKRNNQSLLYVRIVVNKRRIEISLKRTIDPELWDSASGCAKAIRETARELNSFIDDVRFKLIECYRQLQVQHKIITAVAIKSLFLGEEKRENTLCSLSNQKLCNYFISRT